MRILVKTLLLTGLVLFMTSCREQVQVPGNSVSAIPEGQWQLIQLNGAPLQSSGEESVAWLKVSEQNRINGFAGCNSFFGELTIQDNQFKVLNMGMTRKMCLGPDMQIEDTVTAVLSGWSEFSVSENRLILTTSDSELVFQSQLP